MFITIAITVKQFSKLCVTNIFYFPAKKNLLFLSEQGVNREN